MYSAPPVCLCDAYGCCRLSEGLTRDQSFARQLARKYGGGAGGGGARGFGGVGGVVVGGGPPPTVSSVTNWQTPKPSKAGGGGGGGESGGENGGGETGGGGVVNTTAAGITVDSWLDKYELGEYAEGIKGAGYNSMRFLKAACEEVRQRQDKRHTHPSLFFLAVFLDGVLEVLCFIVTPCDFLLLLLLLLQNRRSIDQPIRIWRR